MIGYRSRTTKPSAAVWLIVLAANAAAGLTGVGATILLCAVATAATLTAATLGGRALVRGRWQPQAVSAPLVRTRGTGRPGR